VNLSLANKLLLSIVQESDDSGGMAKKKAASVSARRRDSALEQSYGRLFETPWRRKWYLARRNSGVYEAFPNCNAKRMGS